MVTYKERSHNLRELGFDNYQQYLDSDLWKIISDHILERDAFLCRSRFCKGSRNTLNVQHLNYSIYTLIGTAPQCLITFCKTCYAACEFEGKRKRSLKEVQRETLSMVLGENIAPGTSNPRIGYWFRNQAQLNAPIRKEIMAKVRALPELETA